MCVAPVVAGGGVEPPVSHLAHVDVHSHTHGQLAIGTVLIGVEPGVGHEQANPMAVDGVHRVGPLIHCELTKEGDLEPKARRMLHPHYAELEALCFFFLGECRLGRHAPADEAGVHSLSAPQQVRGRYLRGGEQRLEDRVQPAGLQQHCQRLGLGCGGWRGTWPGT